jgi:hypothetical protein
MAASISLHDFLLTHAGTVRRDMSTGSRIAGGSTVLARLDPGSLHYTNG